MTATTMPRGTIEAARSGASAGLSIIVPVYNEAAGLRRVHAELAEVARALRETHGLACEVVYVDDGSRDESLAVARALPANGIDVQVVALSRNFGKEAALTAGIDHAKGDVLVPMDIDLQDPPELIEPFIARWREGYDIVYGVRTTRPWDTAAKRLSAAWFYRVFNSMSPVRIPTNVGDFRLVDRRAAEVLRQLPERNRFMKGLFAWVGFNAVGVPYERQPRAAGSSKFDLWRLWNFALDGVVSFSTVPLRVSFYAGLAIAAFAALYALFIVSRVLIFGIDTPGYASLIIVVLLMGAIQLVSIGVIGEYLGRLFLEVKARPIYVVEGVYEEGAARPPQV